MAGEFGRYHTLPRNDFGYIAPGELRGCTYSAKAAHYWITALGIWAGKNTDISSSNVTTRLAVYAVDGSDNPTSRLGYSDSFTVSTVMTSAGSGAAHTAAMDAVDVAPPSGVTFTAIPLASNTRLHLAVLGTVGYLGHAMAEAADISELNEKFYDRNAGLPQPPPNPFGSYVSSTQGHVTIWGDATANTAPATPTGLSPSGTINDTVPTFAATFDDAQEALGDYLNQYRIQVRRQSDGVSFWDTTITASSSERTADALSKVYGGTTLVRGTTYEWRCQMSDHFGAWSAWTAWTAFTPANLGFVTLDAAPTGKIEDDTPDFQGRWTHQAAAAMTRVQVRLWNGTGSTVLQTGADYDIADVASSASPGTLFTVPWANTGLTTLAWGTSYQYDIRGYDGTQWSDWSAKRTFNTNAAPSIPANLAPANSAVSSTLPKLTCTATDVDDTTGTGLTVKARIKNSGGGVLETRAMTLVGSTWEYQTLASVNEVQTVTLTGGPTGGTFTLTFEGQTTAGIAWNAAASAVQSALEALSNVAPGDVVCTGGPLPGSTVTVTFGGALGYSNRTQMTGNVAGLTGGTPGITIATPTEGVNADLDGFATYKWDAYSGDGTLWSGAVTVEANATKSAEATFVYAQGPVITITDPTEAEVWTTAGMLVTWTVTDQQKKRVRLYEDGGSTPIYDSGQITSTVTNHLIPAGYLRTGFAYDLTVEVENSAPLTGTSTIRNFTVTFTPPTAVANVQANPVKIGTDIWESAIRLTWDQTTYGTDVWQEYTIERDDLAQPLVRLTSPLQVSYTDYVPVSGHEHTYTITQTILTGLDLLTSTPVTASATISLGGVVLCSVVDPETIRTTLRHTAERDYPREIDEAVYQPLDGSKPTTVRAPQRVVEPSFDAQLVSDAGASAATRRDELDALDASGDTLCYRDNHGRKFFVVMPELVITDMLPAWYVARIGLREEQYAEGVT